MDFNTYQDETTETAIFPDEEGLVYTALGLNGEAGEFAEKVKKLIRDKGGVLNRTPEDNLELIWELGDMLWYTAQAARMLGANLETVARLNLDKLASRKERGKLSGSGDNR